MSKNTHLPLYVDMKGKEVLIFGGGKIAKRRINTMYDFEASVTVVAPSVLPEIKELEGVVIVEKPYTPGMIRKLGESGIAPFIVLAATNDKAVNEEIYKESKALGIAVNNASNQKQCDFMFPAVIRKGDMVIGVTSGGRDHKGTAKMAKMLREDI